VGVNVGLDYLPGSLPLGVADTAGISPELAADVVWFDAYLQNVDRTPRNPNLLLWHRKLWLIDHGASLYTQHSWTGDLAMVVANAGGRFPAIRDHVLLSVAGSISEADARLAPRVTAAVIADAVAIVPDALLEGVEPFATPEDHREAYRAHLNARLQAPRLWMETAEEARLGAA
jgi:hypothetical protein